MYKRLYYYTDKKWVDRLYKKFFVESFDKALAQCPTRLSVDQSSEKSFKNVEIEWNC